MIVRSRYKTSQPVRRKHGFSKNSTRKYNETNVVQYLTKRFGYKPEHNQWKSFSVFNDCLKLVKKYETASLKNYNKRRNDQRSD